MTIKKQYSATESLAIVEKQAEAHGLSPDGLTVLKRIMMVESNGNATVKATGSRALGLFQVIPDTWNEWADKLGLDKTNSDKGDGRLDPNQQAKFAIAFTQANEAKLSVKLDRKPNAGELYLAHFAGAQGAINILTAPDNKMIRDILSPEAMTANGVRENSKGVRLKLKDNSELLFKDFTVADMKVWANRKMAQPDGYETMSPEERARYRRDNGVSDDTPDSFGDMVMSFIQTTINIVASIVKGTGDMVGNLFSPSTPPKATTTAAGKPPPTQLG